MALNRPDAAAAMAAAFPSLPPFRRIEAGLLSDNVLDAGHDGNTVEEQGCAEEEEEGPLTEQEEEDEDDDDDATMAAAASRALASSRSFLPSAMFLGTP